MNHEKFLEYERRAYSTVYAEGENTYHDNIIVDFAKRFLPEMNIDKKGLVLDMGCGPGYLLIDFSSQGVFRCNFLKFLYVFFYQNPV